MASTYSTNLAIELIGTGDQAGSWGNTTNTNLGTLIEQAISGYVTQAVSTGTDTTITIPNGATGVARNMYIELTGTGGTNTNLIVPANKKLYFIFNNSTGAVTVKVSGQTGVSVPQGKKVVLTSNGTDIVNGLNYIADFGSNSATITQLTATSATITNLTLTSLVISNLSIASANVTTLTSASATITNLLGTTLTISGNSFLATSSGNVGIGTSSPAQKLHVAGNSQVKPTTGTDAVWTRTSNDSGEFYLGTDNSAGSGFTGTAYARFIYSTGAYPITFYTNSSQRMLLDSSGNLGIGTSSPANKLQVVASTSGTNDLVTISRFDRATSGTAANGLGGRLEFSAQDNAGSQRTAAFINWGLASVASGSPTGFLSLSTRGTDPALYIDNSGNLGIGTSSPGEKLNVIGGGATTSTVNFTGGSANDNATIASDYSLVFQVDANNTVGGRVFNWRYGGNGYEGGTSLMTLNSSGNLGIGTSSPQSTYKLTISGTDSVFPAVYLDNTTNSKAYSMRVTGTSWIIRDNTAGTDRLTLDTSGNLGIGTSSPGTKLDVNGDIRASNEIYLDNGKYLRFKRNSGGLSIQTLGIESGTDNVRLVTTGTLNVVNGSLSTMMLLDASGNLGVGTTSPGERLEVAGNIKSTGNSSTVVPSTNTQSASFISTNASGNFFHAIDNSTGAAFGAGAYGRVLYSGGAYPMVFFTNDTERARITSGGYFKASNSGSYTNATGTYHEFYQTGTSAVCYFRATNASYTGTVIEGTGDRTTTNASYYLIDVYNGNISGRFRVTDAGNCQNTNSSYGGTSDIKLKQDIVDASSQWDDIKGLRVRKYRFKDKPDEALQIGVIAQELEQVSPGLVEESVDRDKEGNDLGTTTKSVKYSVLYMKAVKALQEAMARIEQLEAKVAALETK